MTATVQVPAMLSIPVGDGQYLTRQLNLIGVDEETYAQVGDFAQYLLHPENRAQLSFALREDGYAPERPKFPPAGWRYRRARLLYEQAYQEQLEIERAKWDGGVRPAPGRGRTIRMTGTITMTGTACSPTRTPT
jgi:lipoprotein-releasing system permease protein